MSHREDFLLHEFQRQQIDQDDLQGQNHRQADIEFDMLRFVAEQLHAGDGADASADGGNTHERGFRNTPEISLGFDLVHQHKQEAERID